MCPFCTLMVLARKLGPIAAHLMEVANFWFADVRLRSGAVIPGPGLGPRPLPGDLGGVGATGVVAGAGAAWMGVAACSGGGSGIVSASTASSKVVSTDPSDGSAVSKEASDSEEDSASKEASDPSSLEMSSSLEVAS